MVQNYIKKKKISSFLQFHFEQEYILRLTTLSLCSIYERKIKIGDELQQADIIQENISRNSLKHFKDFGNNL